LEQSWDLRHKTRFNRKNCHNISILGKIRANIAKNLKWPLAPPAGKSKSRKKGILGKILIVLIYIWICITVQNFKWFGQMVQVLWQFEFLRFWFWVVIAESAAAKAVIFDFLDFFSRFMCKGKFVEKSENLKKIG